MNKLLLLIALSFASIASQAAVYGGIPQKEKELSSSKCYNEGVRTGMVQKLSVKGAFYKSWEGEMVTAGVRPKGESVSNIWYFSVTDKAVAEEINDSIMNGKPVALKYCQDLVRNPFNQSSPYLIIKAKQLSN